MNEAAFPLHAPLEPRGFEPRPVKELTCSSPVFDRWLGKFGLPVNTGQIRVLTADPADGSSGRALPGRRTAGTRATEAPPPPLERRGVRRRQNRRPARPSSASSSPSSCSGPSSRASCGRSNQATRPRRSRRSATARSPSQPRRIMPDGSSPVQVLSIGFFGDAIGDASGSGSRAGGRAEIHRSTRPPRLALPRWCWCVGLVALVFRIRYTAPHEVRSPVVAAAIFGSLGSV